MGKYNLKVTVTGGNRVVKEEQPKNTVVNTTKKIVNVDLKNNSATVDYSDKEKETRLYFMNIVKMLHEKTINCKNAADMIVLRLKEIYVDCISENFHMDMETNEYLDVIVFDNISEMIDNIIQHDTKFHDMYLGVISTSIKSTVTLLDYQDNFDFAKMDRCIKCIGEAFS